MIEGDAPMEDCEPTQEELDLFLSGIVVSDYDQKTGKCTLPNPDDIYVCEWCHDQYTPYIQIVDPTKGYSFMYYCSYRCFVRASSWYGRILRAILRAKCTIKRKIMEPIEKFLYSEKCPYCASPLLVITKSILMCANLDCDEYGSMYEKMMDRGKTVALKRVV
jgi:hypothetical protein